MTRLIARAALRLPFCAALGALAASPGHAAAPPSPEELRELSIEELGRIEVTSVMKRAQAVSRTPAAVYVITNEAIRRSGATSLPEALRLAPNLIVARRSANEYAISARGFNSFEAANKLLVLIDGRSIYTALHGGVFWDQEHMSLRDIERIEVVSGPGGSLWGANAFSGVVNIVRKSAADTKGALINAYGGRPDKGVEARYGFSLGDDAAMRIYAVAADRGATVDALGAKRNDDWSGLQGGFRLDWTPGAAAVMAQGAYYENELSGDTDIKGGNFVVNLEHPLSDSASVALLAYYDKVRRLTPTVLDEFESINVEAKALASFGRHSAVAGAGYRHTDDIFDVAPGASPFFLEPVTEDISIAHVYVQDDIALSSDLSLTLGLKYEYSSFSGGELLPNIRLAFTPDANTLLWASASRAVRTASRIDRDIIGPGILERATDFRAEEVISYEAGVRRSFARASFSASVYFNDYDDLRILTIAPSGLLRFGNEMTGHGYGAEIWGEYQATDWWRLSASVNYLEKDLKLGPTAIAAALDQHQGNDPDFQVQVRSRMDLTPKLSLDVALRAVDDLELPAVPGYIEADARLAYRLTEGVEAAVVGRNLLDPSHPETGSVTQRGEVRRGVHAELILRF